MTNDRIYTFSDALIALYPEGGWSVSYTYDSIIWNHATKTKPTESVLTAKIKELQDAYDSTEYQRKRELEYPKIQDQLDDIYHNGIDAWKATIKVTKDKYPKP